MSLPWWLYLVLAGGVGGVFLAGVFAIRRWGQADAEAEHEKQNRKEIEHELEIVEAQRDIGSRPHKPVDDILDRMSRGDL